MKRSFAFLVCCVALVLPWRMRVKFINGIAWIAQGASFMVFSILRLMLSNLKREGEKR